MLFRLSQNSPERLRRSATYLAGSRRRVEDLERTGLDRRRYRLLNSQDSRSMAYRLRIAFSFFDKGDKPR